jgi:hypothetical protein
MIGQSRQFKQFDRDMYNAFVIRSGECFERGWDGDLETVVSFSM